MKCHKQNVTSICFRICKHPLPGGWLSLRFPSSSAGEESVCNAEDPPSIPGLERSAGKRTGYPLQYSWASLMAQLVKNLPVMWETWVWSLGWEDPLEKRKAAHSSILAWRIPWTIYSSWGRKQLDTTEWLSEVLMVCWHQLKKKQERKAIGRKPENPPGSVRGTPRQGCLRVLDLHEGWGSRVLEKASQIWGPVASGKSLWALIVSTRNMFRSLAYNFKEEAKEGVCVFSHEPQLPTFMSVPLLRQEQSATQPSWNSRRS